MGKLNVSEELLGDESYKEAVENIERISGTKLVAGEVFEFEDSALCNGKECAEGEICVLGNCVKDDVPNNPGG